MSAVKKSKLLSVEEYLATELDSPVKREYVEGRTYVMAGARNVHNDISGNTFSAFRLRVRGGTCRAMTSDVKVRIRIRRRVRFYYPDAGITCRPNPGSDTFQDNPVIIAEVLSPSTRRTDEGEKREAYLAIRSLAVYLLIEQDQPFVVAHRRSGTAFVREEYGGLDAVIPLPEIGAALPLAEIYEDVEFAVPAENDEEEPR